ncbi:recombinase family protein, partial [Lachnospiraceae bacterium 47-T17]
MREKNGFTGIRHFTDDGISGTTFEREGLQAKLAEVEKGNIGTIIVKDMSRLGRNYVQMGMLREQLRRANVRLIAVNEGVDTGSGFDDDFLPFRDVINEYYAKNISKKIKSTFKAKGESGKHIASSPPHGYLKDSGGKMYVHRVNNGKRVPMYVCGNYAKQPVGTLCKSAHRIKADHVMEIAAKTIREVVKYANFDKKRFAEEIQSHIEDRQTVDLTEQKKRMAVCEKRIGELEMLIAKIYEDDALGKLSDKRYTMLYNQYEGEQEQFQNEFVEKIIVHERDRKGSADTTQKIEIYFNFIGEYIPPTMAEKEPTPEELEEMRKNEARKDKLHQNHLKRKASGKQKEYEERTKAKKKAQIESQKEQIIVEDREKGIYFHAGVPNAIVNMRGGADKKLDFHGLRKELEHYVLSGQNRYCITGLSPVRFCNHNHTHTG